MKKHITFLSSVMAFMVLVAFTPISETDGYYVVNKSESTVQWKAQKITGSGHEGTVNISEGGLQVEAGKIVAGKFTIDMTTIATTDLDGGMAKKLIGHLNSEDFFAVDKHKTANLSIIGMEGDNVKANLTIKGITNEINFPVTMAVVDGVLTATAEIKVDRSKFDVRYGSDSFFDNLGNKAIDNIITFNVTLKGNA